MKVGAVIGSEFAKSTALFLDTRSTFFTPSVVADFGSDIWWSL